LFSANLCECTKNPQNCGLSQHPHVVQLSTISVARYPPADVEF
jgi:hypothetical protein